MLMQYYYPIHSLCFQLANCPQNIYSYFFPVQDPIQDHISLVFFIFYDFDIFENYSPVIM